MYGTHSYLYKKYKIRSSVTTYKGTTTIYTNVHTHTTILWVHICVKSKYQNRSFVTKVIALYINTEFRFTYFTCLCDIISPDFVKRPHPCHPADSITYALHTHTTILWVRQKQVLKQVFRDQSYRSIYKH